MHHGLDPILAAVTIGGAALLITDRARHHGSCPMVSIAAEMPR